MLLCVRAVTVEFTIGNLHTLHTFFLGSLSAQIEQLIIKDYIAIVFVYVFDEEQEPITLHALSLCEGWDLMRMYAIL